MVALLKKYNTFIFDWDGTLSSMKFLRAVNERLNPHWKYRKMQTLETSKVSKQYVIRNKERELRFFAPLFDLSIRFMKPKLHNDSIEVLKELRKRGKTVVLFTNGASYRVKRELSFLKITDCFDMIVSAQEINALKPNPLGLELIIKRTRSKKSETMYVGDMVDDVATARFAKVSSCAMACGLDGYAKLKAARPDYIFRSMEEFKKAL